jgi:hypothetical protein
MKLTNNILRDLRFLPEAASVEVLSAGGAERNRPEGALYSSIRNV